MAPRKAGVANRAEQSSDGGWRVNGGPRSAGPPRVKVPSRATAAPPSPASTSIAGPPGGKIRSRPPRERPPDVTPRTPRPAEPLFLEFLQTITGVFVVVYDGQHALKFTLGRAKAVVGPGVHWKWPIIQRFQVEDTRHTTLDLEPQVIQLEDDLVYEVDAKVLYQIVDLMKAIVEVDDLVTGLQNRVVLAIQRILSAQTRESVRDTDAIIAAIRRELELVEAQWGVKVLQLGFSNLSPSPATLEITQLDLLARERHQLYEQLVEAGLAEDAAVALVTGAVVATHPLAAVAGLRDERRALSARAAAAEAEQEQQQKQTSEQQRSAEDPFAEGGGEDPQAPKSGRE